MKNKLLITAAFVFAFAVVLHHYEKPVMAQVRAALVQNIDEPGRSPFSLTLSCNAGGTNFCEGTSSTAVPANKRFVVQNVNGTVNFFGSATVAIGTVFVVNGSRFYLDPHFVGISFGQYIYAINMPVVAYFEAGQTPSIDIIGSNTTNPPGATVFLTGYLIDLTE
jgi:hypothetical protein